MRTYLGEIWIKCYGSIAVGDRPLVLFLSVEHVGAVREVDGVLIVELNGSRIIRDGSLIVAFREFFVSQILRT